MKKIAIIITMVIFLSSQALALDRASVNISIKVDHKPTIDNLRPTDGYVITEGGTLHIEVTADDRNADDLGILEYQYYINDAIKRRWSTENTFDYVLTGNDIGSNSIYVDVRDNSSTVRSAPPVEIYVFRGSPALPE